MKTEKDIDYSFQHTQSRFLKRYGLEITKEDYLQLCEDIKNQNPLSIEVQKDDTQKLFEVTFKDKKFIAVWSMKRNCITTVFDKRSNKIDSQSVQTRRIIL